MRRVVGLLHVAVEHLLEVGILGGLVVLRAHGLVPQGHGSDGCGGLAQRLGHARQGLGRVDAVEPDVVDPIEGNATAGQGGHLEPVLAHDLPGDLHDLLVVGQVGVGALRVPDAGHDGAHDAGDDVGDALQQAGVLLAQRQPEVPIHESVRQDLADELLLERQLVGRHTARHRGLGELGAVLLLVDVGANGVHQLGVQRRVGAGHLVGRLMAQQRQVRPIDLVTQEDDPLDEGPVEELVGVVARG